MRRGLWERSWLDDWCSREVVVEDGLAVGLEDGFGGHVERMLIVLCREKV